jgi:hypothetical protein
VQAQNGAGFSLFSNEVAITPQKVLVAPVVSVVAGDGKATLSWAAVAGATGYQIAQATADGTESFPGASASGTTFTDSGLLNGTTYYYKVRAVNANAQGPASAQVTALPAREICVGSNRPYVFAVDADAAGEQLARRTFGGSTLLFSPSAVAVDNTHHEVFAANAGSASVTVYPPTAGDTPPSRILAGPLTQLHNPAAITLDASAGVDRLFVWDATPSGSNAGSILIFPRAASGNTAPTASISIASSSCSPTPTAALTVNPGNAFYFSCGKGIVSFTSLQTSGPPAVVRANLFVTALAFDAVHALIVAALDSTNPGAAPRSVVLVDPANGAAPLPAFNNTALNSAPIPALAYDSVDDDVVALVPGSVLFFHRTDANTTGATATPARTASTNVFTSTGVDYDAANQMLWISENTDSRILTLASTDNGVGSGISVPIYPGYPSADGIAVDFVNDRLWVASDDSQTPSNSEIYAFPLTDSLHASFPSIKLPPSPSATLWQAGGPFDVVLNGAANELYVMVLDPAATGGGGVQVWTSTNPSASAPVRSITGLNGPGGIAFDNGQLFVGENGNGGTSPNDILIYTRNADGTFTATGSISGAATLLNSPSTLSVDATGIRAVNNNAQVLQFARNATGNAAGTVLIAPTLGPDEYVGHALRDAAGTIFVSISTIPIVTPYTGTASNPPRFRIEAYTAPGGGAYALHHTIKVTGAMGTSSNLAFCN